MHSCFSLYTVLSMFQNLCEPSIVNSCSLIHLMSNESLRPFYARNSIKCLGILQCLFLYLLCIKEFIAYKLSVSSTLCISLGMLYAIHLHWLPCRWFPVWRHHVAMVFCDYRASLLKIEQNLHYNQLSIKMKIHTGMYDLKRNVRWNLYISRRRLMNWNVKCIEFLISFRRFRCFAG